MPWESVLIEHWHGNNMRRGRASWVTDRRTSECQNAVARDHRCACPTAMATAIHAPQGRKDVLLIDSGFSGLVEFAGKDVQHQLAVTVGVDVSVGLLVKELAQLRSIDEVAVVREDNSVGAVDVKWLGF